MTINGNFGEPDPAESAEQRARGESLRRIDPNQAGAYETAVPENLGPKLIEIGQAVERVDDDPRDREIARLRAELARVRSERDRLFDILVEDDQRASRARGSFRPVGDSVRRMIGVLSRPYIFANPVGDALAEHDRRANA